MAGCLHIAGEGQRLAVEGHLGLQANSPMTLVDLQDFGTVAAPTCGLRVLKDLKGITRCVYHSIA